MALKFRPKHRIRKDKEVEKVLEQGRRLSNDFFILSWLDPPASASIRARLALRIPRRFGNAVARNRAKRWLREIFRQEIPHFSKSADMVLMIKPQPDLGKPVFASAREKFLALCRQAGLFSSHVS